jgi:hypothetical protein
MIQEATIEPIKALNSYAFIKNHIYIYIYIYFNECKKLYSSKNIFTKNASLFEVLNRKQSKKIKSSCAKPEQLLEFF